MGNVRCGAQRGSTADLSMSRPASISRASSERATQAARRALGKQHILSIKAASSLADMLLRDATSPRAHVLEAEAILEDNIVNARRSLGAQHPDSLHAVSLLGWARKRLVSDEADQAEEAKTPAEAVHKAPPPPQKASGGLLDLVLVAAATAALALAVVAVAKRCRR